MSTTNGNGKVTFSQLREQVFRKAAEAAAAGKPRRARALFESLALWDGFRRK